MKKMKVTTKEIKRTYKTIINLVYDTDYLFPDADAIAFNSGVYGWNYDLFTVNNVAILRGYRVPCGFIPDKEVTELYNNKAKELEKIRYTNKKAYMEALYNLQVEYINKI